MNIFNNAIETHAEWKRQLIKHVKQGERQDVENIANCHACELGQWIDGEGSRYGSLPSFVAMQSAHEKFHKVAAEIVAHSNAGEQEKAIDLLKHGGACSQSSAKLVAALMECSKELSDSVVVGVRGRDKIFDILKTKSGPEILSISADASIFDAAKLMVDHNVGAVAVYKEDIFIGIFTERGYLQNMVNKGVDTLHTPVSEVVDMETISVHPDDSVEQCMVLMTSTRTRHLPVKDHGKLIGMVSIGDIIKKIVCYNDERVMQLERYIHGQYMA
jgi:CBS domain-containing protein